MVFCGAKNDDFIVYNSPVWTDGILILTY